MSTPDIRVRLSPEGIKEVVFALRELQKEAQKSSREAASGVNNISAAVRDLKSLLPTIGLAAAIAGFAGMARAALDTADKTGKLQQRVGGTVEDISALSLAFRTNESSLEGLQGALDKTAKVMGEVQNGSADTKAALRAINIDPDVLAKLGNDTPRALESIAKGLQAIPPGAQRAAAAQAIFGKSSGDLLVALDAVGEQGIGAFIEKARELGVLIDSDLAGAAARANDALGIVKLQAEGLATQFVSGLAPAIASSMEDISKSVTGKGVNGFEYFGRVIGVIVSFVTSAFIGAGAVIGATVANIASYVEEAIDIIKSASSLNGQGIADAARRGVQQRAAIAQSLKDDLANLGKRFLDGPQATAAKPARPGGGATVQAKEDVAKVSAARQAAMKQAIADELKLVQERLKSEEASYKAQYDQNLISLQTYLDKRRELINRSAEADITALKAQRQLLAGQLTKPEDGQTEQDRIRLRQQIASTSAEITAREIQQRRELAGIDADQAAETLKLNQERTALSAKLAELEGDRHAAFQANLDEEIRTIRELGIRAGESVDEIEAKVQRLSAARNAQFNFDEATRAGSLALESFQRDAEQIHRDQEAGIISQLEGEQRLIELEGQRIVVLKQLAAAMLEAAAATGDPEQIAKAQSFAASVDQIAASYRSATDVALQFKQGGIEAFQNGLQSLLENADKIHSVGDAFKSLALTIAQQLNKIAAEILAKQATLALLRAFGLASGGGGGIPATGAKTGGYVRGYAGGGDIAGKPLAIRGPDKIPILAQKGEFMMRKARVQEPGALSFLRAWNSGSITLAQAMRLPKYAEGGEIAAGAAPGAPRSGPGQLRPNILRSINILDPNLLGDYVNSSSGEQTFINFISRNSSTIKRLLGG